MSDNQIDTGDLMDCLVQNKHQKEMNEKCAVGVTHFQLVSRWMKMCYHDVLAQQEQNKKLLDVTELMLLISTDKSYTLCFHFCLSFCLQIQIKDFRFSYKFKTACKEDVLKLCPNIKKK